MAGAHVGKYELIERLSRGSMGAVYRAHDPVLDDALVGRTRVSNGVAGAAVEQTVEVTGGAVREVCCISSSRTTARTRSKRT